MSNINRFTLLFFLCSFGTKFSSLIAQEGCGQVPFFGVPGQDVLYTDIEPLTENLTAFGITGRVIVNAPLVAWNFKEIYMDANAEILVQSNQSVDLVEASFYGCSSMWNGFVLEENANLKLENGSIQDAKVGIESNGNTTITLRNVDVLNCYKGMHVRAKIGGPKYANPKLYLAGTIFDGSGPLKYPFAGLKSLVGIQMEYINNFDLTDNEFSPWPVLTRKNTFKGSENGIKLLKCTGIIDNASFYDLSLIAIYAEESNLSGDHNYIHSSICGLVLIKSTFNFYATFRSVRYGAIIMLTPPGMQSNLFLSGVDMNYGVTGFLNPNAKIWTRPNISVSQSGGSFQDWIISGKYDINDGVIYLIEGGLPSMPEWNGKGVVLTNIGTPFDEEQSTICSNLISWHGEPDFFSLNFMDIENCNNVLFSNNHLRFISSVPISIKMNIGIYCSMSDMCDVHCNEFEVFGNGKFAGVVINNSCMSTDLTTNDFEESELAYAVTGVTGEQEHGGNIFGTTDALHPGAIHFGATPIQELSNYFVDGSESATFLPMTNGTTNWFVDEVLPGEEPSCSRTILPDCIIPFNLGGNPISNYTVKVRDGQLPMQQMSDLSKWLARRQTLTQIAYHALFNDTEWNNFWNANINTSAGSLLKMQMVSYQWKINHASLIQTISSYQTELYDLLNSEHNSELKDSSINSIVTQLDFYYNQYYASFNVLVSELIALNNQMPESYIFEINEKEVSKILLPKLISAAYPINLSENEISILEAIAAQCPNEGGPAVYASRGVLNLYNNEYFFEDDDLCLGVTPLTSERNISKMHFSNGLNAQIRPNPTNDGNFVLELDNSKMQNLKTFLTDLAGRVICEKLISNDSSQVEFNYNLRPGVYVLRVLDNYGKTCTSLLVSVIN